jgi:two-component system phosphate regulon sensor histidine kinase PhoR
MKKKLIVINSVVMATALITLFLVGFFTNRSSIYSQAENNIVLLTKSYCENYSGAAPTVSSKDVRLTIIDPEGNVISDSQENDVSQMENHLEREEIQSALAGSPKVVYRNSYTLNEDMLYYALIDRTVPNYSYVFVRVALTISDVDAYLYYYIPWTIGALGILIILAIATSAYASEKSFKPLEEIRNNLQALSFSLPLQEYPNSKDKTVNSIMNEITTLSQSIENNVLTLERETNHLNLVLNNVSDAIIVFSSNHEITFFNERAGLIFDMSNPKGHDFSCLSSNPSFIDNLNQSFASSSSHEFDFENKGRIYHCVSAKDKDDETLLALHDVSEERRSASLRKEFFDNASHELKTPLTSIRGFSELIALQNKDPTLTPYIQKIESESERMHSLIDDMLSLSKLENSQLSTGVKTDLSSLTKEVFQSLAPLASKGKISLSSEGKASANISHDDAFSLIRNLVENSIFYNQEGGHVLVSLKSSKTKTTITISDDGIGIAKEDQARIFERFYRVDKSRSRATGGTGLGLSIVKHIVELYKGKIDLASKLGEGTTITITLFNY